MYERYRRRVSRRELAFDNPGTREGHSLVSVREFYAEGYSVFHGPHISSQARLFHFAPELYNLLEDEANNANLPTPDRSELSRSRRQQRIR
jgi:hypothetical protein